MTEEGVLYKKLKDVLEKAEQEAWDSFAQEVEFNDLKPVLDEAKRDKEEMVEMTYVESTGEYIDGWRRWFEKWFGSGEAEKK